MKQIDSPIMRSSFTLCFCLITSIAFCQNDSALLLNLNQRKQVFSKQIAAIQDSIIVIDKHIISLESNMKLAKYMNGNNIMASLRAGNKIRKQPDAISQIIGNIHQDVMVELLDYNSNDYWLIKSDNLVGFVSTIYIIYNDEITAVQESFEKRNIIRQEEQLKKLKEELSKKAELMDAQYNAAQEKRKKDLITKYGEKIGTKVYNGHYWIGMSDDMAKESLGDPDNINRTVGRWGVHEQWIYYNVYLYFENGILTSYQD